MADDRVDRKKEKESSESPSGVSPLPVSSTNMDMETNDKKRLSPIGFLLSLCGLAGLTILTYCAFTYHPEGYLSIWQNINNSGYRAREINGFYSTIFIVYIFVALYIFLIVLDGVLDTIRFWFKNGKADELQQSSYKGTDKGTDTDVEEGTDNSIEKKVERSIFLNLSIIIGFLVIFFIALAYDFALIVLTAIFLITFYACRYSLRNIVRICRERIKE